jgi:HD-GYP domain-containing protein (c-di-GMP phosphodiesterase class II)
MKAERGDLVETPFEHGGQRHAFGQSGRPVHDAFDPIVSVAEGYREALGSFGRILESRDIETGAHSKRVVAYSLKLGAALHLEPLDLIGIEQGAALHDIGKIGVPDAILNKPGQLTEAEQRIMRQHVQHGLDIVSGVPLLSDARFIIGQHHERFEGSGYPLGLRAQDIHVHARIFAVVDALDAILSDRPYRKAQPYTIARDEIRANSGSHFDPGVVEAFLDIAEEEWLMLRNAPALHEFPGSVVSTCLIRDWIAAMARGLGPDSAVPIAPPAGS